MSFNISPKSRYYGTSKIKYPAFRSGIDVDMFSRWTGMSAFSGVDPIVSIVATPEIAGRCDLIAKRVYGDESYWWIIQAYNGSFDINYPKVGDNVSIPDLHQIINP